MSVLKSRKPLIGIDWLVNSSDVRLAADFHRLWNNPNVRSMFTPRTESDGKGWELLVMYDHQQLNTPERKQFVDILANIRERLLRPMSHDEAQRHPLTICLGGGHKVRLGAETMGPPWYSLNLGQHSYHPRPPASFPLPLPDGETWLYVLIHTLDGTLLI